MSRRRDVLVGLVIVAGVLIIFFGTVWLRGGGLMEEQMTVQARFREVGQLLEGNTVKLRGVPIGSVEDVVLEQGGAGVLVTMQVDPDVALPSDAVVLLSPESMFGDWQAEIHPRSRFPRYDYAEPRTSGVLPGYSLPDISRLTAVADRIAENLAVLSERVEIAFTEESALRVRDAIENIQQLSAQLTSLVQRQEASLEDVAEDLTATTQTVGEAAEAIGRIAAQVEGAVAGGELAEIVENVHRASVQFDSLTTVLVGLGANFSATMVTADTTFQALSDVTRLVAEGEGTLGLLMADSTLYYELVRTNEQLQALLKDLRENPGRYVRISVF